MVERQVDDFTIDEGYSVGEYKRCFNELVAKMEDHDPTADSHGSTTDFQGKDVRKRLRTSVWEVSLPGKPEDRSTTRAVLLGWTPIIALHDPMPAGQIILDKDSIYLFGPKVLPSGACPIEKIDLDRNAAAGGDRDGGKSATAKKKVSSFGLMGTSSVKCETQGLFHTVRLNLADVKNALSSPSPGWLQKLDSEMKSRGQKV